MKSYISTALKNHWKKILSLYIIGLIAFGSISAIKPSLYTADEMMAAYPKDAEYVVGDATTAAVIHVLDTLLNKPGGYLSNDILSKIGVWDNMPSFELGAIYMTRDLFRTIREDFSRSQSQSVENPILKKKQPDIDYRHNSFMLPRTESTLRSAMEGMIQYREGISDVNVPLAQFHTRAESLADYLSTVAKRMGSYNQQLAANSGQRRVDTNLANDPDAQQSTPTPAELTDKNGFFQVDNVWHETRGATYAAVHFLRAIEVDYAVTLKKKGATISIRQIIRELESTQESYWSTPFVFNGSGRGWVPNHSDTLSASLGRANSALLDIVRLLKDG
ncbi:DUF2333 family protein [Vibrio splendidus]